MLFMNMATYSFSPKGHSIYVKLFFVVLSMKVFRFINESFSSFYQCTWNLGMPFLQALEVQYDAL